MPGYCVAGTIGHKVLSGAKKIEIDKKMVNVRLSVQYMSFRWANLFNQFLQIKELSLVLWMLTCYMYVHVCSLVLWLAIPMLPMLHAEKWEWPARGRLGLDT